MLHEQDMLDVDEIVRTLSIELLGVVEDDDEVIRATNTGEPVALQPSGKAALAYRNIARRLLGENVPLQAFEQEKVSVFTKMKTSLESVKSTSHICGVLSFFTRISFFPSSYICTNCIQLFLCTLAERKKGDSMKNRRVEEIKNGLRKGRQSKKGWRKSSILLERILIVKQYLLKMEKKIHPLFRKEVFFFKVLLSAILVLSVAILYKNAPSFDGAKAVTEKVMKEEFQFATVAKWYEKQFGKPLVFYSPNEKKKGPFSKRLCHSCFRKGDARVSKNGQGVFVQTATNATVESVNEG